jgi:hypothetical protein
MGTDFVRNIVVPAVTILGTVIANSVITGIWIGRVNNELKNTADTVKQQVVITQQLQEKVFYIAHHEQRISNLEVRQEKMGEKVSHTWWLTKAIAAKNGINPDLMNESKN